MPSMPPANMQQKKLATSTRENSTLVLDRSSAFPAMDPPMADRLQYSRKPASSSPAASSMAGTLNRPVSRPTLLSTSSSGRVTPVCRTTAPPMAKPPARPAAHTASCRSPARAVASTLPSTMAPGSTDTRNRSMSLEVFSRITLAAVLWPYSSTRKYSSISDANGSSMDSRPMASPSPVCPPVTVTSTGAVRRALCSGVSSARSRASWV